MSDMKKAISCIKYLGVSVDLGTFSKRKQLQKLVYLIQSVSGIDLGINFTWYLHGPYSPLLTDFLYENNRIPKGEVEINQNEKKRLYQLKMFLGEDINSSENIEIIVSLHFLLVLGKKCNKTDEEMIKLLKEKKPFISEEKIMKYYPKIKELMNITS